MLGYWWDSTDRPLPSVPTSLDLAAQLVFSGEFYHICWVSMTWAVHSSLLLRFSPHLTLLQILGRPSSTPHWDNSALSTPSKSQRKCSPISPFPYLHRPWSHFFCFFIAYSLWALQLAPHLRNYTGFPALQTLDLLKQGKTWFYHLPTPIVYVCESICEGNGRQEK